MPLILVGKHQVQRIAKIGNFASRLMPLHIRQQKSLKLDINKVEIRNLLNELHTYGSVRNMKDRRNEMYEVKRK